MSLRLTVENISIEELTPNQINTVHFLSYDYFTIGGCGMDMIFHTNYTIIHRLYKLGFMTKKECEKLCQMTPSII